MTAFAVLGLGFLRDCRLGLCVRGRAAFGDWARYYDIWPRRSEAPGPGWATLHELGIECPADTSEPEDHVAILCELMAGLASRAFPVPPSAERTMFERHLAPWIGQFFAHLEARDSADFYRAVGAVGRAFMAVEAEAFAVASQAPLLTSKGQTR